MRTMNPMRWFGMSWKSKKADTLSAVVQYILYGAICCFCFLSRRGGFLWIDRTGWDEVLDSRLMIVFQRYRSPLSTSSSVSVVVSSSLPSRPSPPSTTARRTSAASATYVYHSTSPRPHQNPPTNHPLTHE
ncbi:hypothetical protein BDV06DRAFT_207212 [Aspergillus oleicola]